MKPVESSDQPHLLVGATFFPSECHHLMAGNWSRSIVYFRSFRNDQFYKQATESRYNSPMSYAILRFSEMKIPTSQVQVPARPSSAPQLTPPVPQP